ncbi:MAG: hypothetical protein SAJ12_03055 [Jaaginema sp. PMC 1079.18]|nr:hypothetical protein [Jaaginema sp. PMC 1080.18]MEC4849966.1 hypothetical protein [Jaaginema sp. PMC 1079.18]MEC4866939.1 hypothetical protein [Jaaginema sp. PMC 1078.18]
MKVISDAYSVWYDSSTEIIFCQGSLRLSGMTEYQPIVELLDTVLEQTPQKIVLDFRELEFLNSSGINVFSKFVIRVRQQKNTAMKVLGSKSVPWQGKSLKNLKRLMPSLELDWI